MLHGFISALFRLDQSNKGIILYVRDNMGLFSNESSPTEGFYVGINLQNKKKLAIFSVALII